MSAPTLWEEGRWSGSRVTRFSVFACSLLVAANIAISGELDRIFDVGFVTLCIAMALAIRPTEFFDVGILPPILILGFCVGLSIIYRGAIAPADDGFVQAVVSGLAHHSGGLLAGYAVSLGVLAVRTRVIRRSAAGTENLTAHHGPGVAAGYSNRAASPAPYRVTSGAPEVKSTTVVGNEPQSPESMTASKS